MVLQLEFVAIVYGYTGIFVRFMRLKLMSKTQKHNAYKTLGKSMLISIKALISKACNDGHISKQEFNIVIGELDKYNDLKAKTSKQIGLSEAEQTREIITKTRLFKYIENFTTKTESFQTKILILFIFLLKT